MHDASHCPTPTPGIRMTPSIVRAALLAGALSLASCGGDTPTSPDVRSASDLRLLHVAPGTPALATTQASFWAVKGRNAGIDLWYHALPGRSDSTKFLELRLGGASLDRRPDGTPFAPGDSVLITLQVTDAVHLVVDYQPSGLRFSATDLPKLRMFYSFCGDDLNYDGVVDGEDDRIASQLSIWKQEAAGQSWFRLSSLVVKDTKQVEAQIAGFTGYAIMY